MKNQDLIGKYYLDEGCNPSLCVVLGVAENNPSDIIYQIVGTDYTHVQFASFVRKNMTTKGKELKPCGKHNLKQER